MLDKGRRGSGAAPQLLHGRRRRRRSHIPVGLSSASQLPLPRDPPPPLRHVSRIVRPALSVTLGSHYAPPGFSVLTVEFGADACVASPTPSKISRS